LISAEYQPITSQLSVDDQSNISRLQAEYQPNNSQLSSAEYQPIVTPIQTDYQVKFQSNLRFTSQRLLHGLTRPA
jgi:hypothetical protein